MNNLDLLKALNDIDDKFLLDDYQPKNSENSLNYFRERGFSMKKLKLKYVLSPICVMAIVLVSFVMINRNNKDDIIIAKNDNKIVEESNPKLESTTSKNDEININKLGAKSEFNIDAKWIDANLKDEFEFLNKIYVPENLKEVRQGKIYVRKDIEDNDYKEFKQYSIMFTDKSEEEIRNLEFNFSKNELLRDCVPTGIENAKESIIDGTIVKLFANERTNETSVISGEAYFEYNDYKFDIQVYRLTQEEFIKIVTSIVKEIKKQDFKVEDKDIGVKEIPQENENNNTGTKVEQKTSNNNTKIDYSSYFGGKYVDNKGNNVILLTEDNESIRKDVCNKLGISESQTIFKNAKYSYAYLTELQNNISKAMANKELPFVTSSALKDDTNNIEITVTSKNEVDLNKIKSYDTIGGAIEIKYSENKAIVE